jgi:hypothetical protein
MDPFKQYAIKSTLANLTIDFYVLLSILNIILVDLVMTDEDVTFMFGVVECLSIIFILALSAWL